MAEDLITNTLQSLAVNVESSIKDYIDEKITKEDKREEITTHITVAKLRIRKAFDEAISQIAEDEPQQRRSNKRQ